MCDTKLIVIYVTDRRKSTAKYHEPLRRISTYRSDTLRPKEKKSLKRHKKHKKENEREARLQQLVNHEDVKAESRKKSGYHHRHHGGSVAPSDSTDGTEGKNDTTLDIDVYNKSENIPSLTSREVDTIEEAQPIPSPENRYVEDKNAPDPFELREIKVDIPVTDEVNTEVKVPSLLSREDDGTDVGVPLSSVLEQNNDIQANDVQPPSPQQFQQLKEIEHFNIDTPNEEDALLTTTDMVDKAFQKTPASPQAVSTPKDDNLKDMVEDDDDDVGIQMIHIGETPSGKPIRKFVTKDRDSFIDILPKIQEHSELPDEPVRVVVSEYGVDNRSEKLKEEQEDIESHHRAKEGLKPDPIMGIKRHHHHRKHPHRKHEVKQHRTISEREALAEQSRIRSGLKTLQETEVNYLESKKRSGSLEGEKEALGNKDLEEIACKSVNHSCTKNQNVFSYDLLIFIIFNIKTSVEEISDMGGSKKFPLILVQCLNVDIIF